MAITVPQISAKNRTTGATSLTGASGDWGSNVTGGNTLVVVAWVYNDPNDMTWGTVDDSLGNTFTKAIDNPISVGTDRFSCAIYYKNNATGGGKPAITVRVSTSCTIIFGALEIAGLNNSAPDQTAVSSAAGSTTSAVSGAITTTVADEILIYVVNQIDANPQTHTVPTSFTRIVEETDNNTYQGGDSSYRIVSSIQTAQTYTETTNNSRNTTALASFKITSGGVTAGGIYLPLLGIG